MANFYEELGRAVAEEFGITEDMTIEHQCGTVWVEKDGKVYAIGCTETEGD